MRRALGNAQSHVEGLAGWFTTAALPSLLIPVTMVVVGYMNLGSYNRPMADDYCVMYFGERLGLFRSVWYWYITWHGGYSASAMDWLLSAAGYNALPWLTVLSIITWVLVSTSVAKMGIFSGAMSSFNIGASLLTGTLLVSTILIASPDIPQSLLWWGGARGYFAPILGGTFYLFLYLVFTRRSWKPWQTYLWYLASFLLIVFCGGFSEIYSPVQVVFFSALALWGGLKRRFADKRSSYLFLLAGAIGALLSMAIMILAPGNQLRREFFPAPLNFFTILSLSSTGYLKFLGSLFASMDSLSAIVGAVCVVIWLGIVSGSNKGRVVREPRHIFVILATGFILAFGCFPSPVYGTAEIPHPRTLIIPLFFMITALIASGIMLGVWVSSHIHNAKKTQILILAPAFFLVLFSTLREVSHLLVIRPEYVYFAEQWDKVDMDIKNAKKAGQNEVVIPAMDNWAKLERPTDNPRYWPNKCYSKYYDIQVLSTAYGESDE